MSWTPVPGEVVWLRGPVLGKAGREGRSHTNLRTRGLPDRAFGQTWPRGRELWGGADDPPDPESGHLGSGLVSVTNMLCGPG